MELTTARDLFKKLKDQKLQDLTSLKIENTPGLEALLKNYKSASEFILKQGNEEFFDYTFECARDNYSAQDLEFFSLILPTLHNLQTFDDASLGVLLSVFTNKCKAENITLRLDHLDKKMSCFSFVGKKNVTIYGRFGDNIGSYLKEGCLEIYGSAVEVGNGMTGGIIRVHGQVDYISCNDPLGPVIPAMITSIRVYNPTEGGQIFVYSDRLPGFQSTILGGELHWNDVLIAKEGELMNKDRWGYDFDNI